VCLLVVTIPRFIQLRKSLKPMGQSRHGVTQVMEALPEGAPMPPPFEPPHAVIDPSALRVAKAYLFE
jgi:hypothetical protein